jgi:hypothetical protein
MHFHVFPHPAYRAGRQSAVCLRCSRQRRNINRARARVQVAVRWIARGTRRFGWSHKRGPTVIAAGDQQSGGDIAPVLAPEEVDVSLENRPQAGTRLEPAIIEQEGRARDPVCADDASSHLVYYGRAPSDGAPSSFRPWRNALSRRRRRSSSRHRGHQKRRCRSGVMILHAEYPAIAEGN